MAVCPKLTCRSPVWSGPQPRWQPDTRYCPVGWCNGGRTALEGFHWTPWSRFPPVEMERSLRISLKFAAYVSNDLCFFNQHNDLFNVSGSLAEVNADYEASVQSYHMSLSACWRPVQTNTTWLNLLANELNRGAAVVSCFLFPKLMFTPVLVYMDNDDFFFLDIVP